MAVATGAPQPSRFVEIALLLCKGSTLINLGFSLFAYDALLLFFISSYLSTETENKQTATRLKNRIDAISKQLTNRADKIDTEISKGKLDELSRPLTDYAGYHDRKSRYHSRRCVWGTGIIDVLFFILSSVFLDLSSNGFAIDGLLLKACFIPFLVLCAWHIVLTIWIFLGWEKSKQKREEIQRVEKEVEVIVLYRQIEKFPCPYLP